VRQLREAYRAWLSEVAAGELVFVDEMGSQLGMSRLYARSPKGQRAHGSLIRNRGANLTTIGALSCTGMQAAMVFTGATDKTAFLTFIHQVLLPTLRPGQIVVMDNLGAHRARGVQQAIEAAGCTVIFTPPYSPEFNPIEECWSKVKAILRGIAARTRESLTQAIASAFDLITLQDIQGWFNHAGYCMG